MITKTDAPSKLSVLFSGVDGTGKTTCLDTVIERLDDRHRVLRVGTTGIYLSVGGHRESLVNPKWEERVQYLRETSRRFHLQGVFLMLNFVYKYLLSRYYQFFKDADLVMFETDTLLHPAVYITYHFPWAAKVLSPRARFRIVSTLFGSPGKTLIFYLEADPEVSVERVQRREREKGIPVEPHENAKDLAILHEQFETVLGVAAERGYEIVRIDTSQKTIDQVVDDAEAVLRARLAPEPPLAAEGCSQPGLG